MNPPITAPALVPETALDTRFFGHPRGLSTLFFTEMWERFSFYGMRALLILFMTAAPAAGGLGFDAPTAGAIYGLYTARSTCSRFPGGWIADRADRAAARRAATAASSSPPDTSAWRCQPDDVLPRSGADRDRHRPAEGKRQRHRRPAVRRRRRAPRCGVSRSSTWGSTLGAFVAPLVCGYSRVSV